MEMEDETQHYLQSLLPKSKPWVDEIEQEAKENKVPIMDQVSVQFLMKLIQIKHPTHVLEVGTGIGYSALRMLDAKSDMKIVTIERDLNRYHRAVEIIKARNKEGKIQVIHGDAKDVLEDLNKKQSQFDFIFIDATKGEYEIYFKLASLLLPKHGLIVSDNVLFRGYVASNAFIPPRYKNLVHKLKRYNKWLMEHELFDTSIIPIGDGVALSFKK